MAWTTPATFADTTVYDEDDLNAQIKDNLSYLKDRADRIGVAATADNSRTGGAAYQVSTSKVAFCTIRSSCGSVKVENANPPTITACDCSEGSIGVIQSFAFIVPVSSYGLVTTTTTAHEVTI